MKHSDSTPSPAADFYQIGQQFLLPGMTYMVERMQALVDEFRAALAAGGAPKKRGRPKGLSPQAAYWAKMKPAERAAEMKRRGMVGRRAAKADLAKLHPRDERSPRHEEYVAKLRKAGQARWDQMSAKKRKAHSDAMKRARTKQAETAREAVNEARQAKANGAVA